MEIATLGIAATSEQVSEANRQLDRIVANAGKAERATKRFGTESERTGTATEQMGRRIERTERASRGLDRRMGGMTRTAQGLYRQLLAVGAALGAAFSAGAAISGARQLDRAVGELSTLLPGATAELAAMNVAGREFGVAFGTGTEAQVRAFYTAVSAGATDAAEATARVDAANRLAIGGVTDLQSAISVLNASTNAYAADNLTAADAADILFTGVRTGVTTIDELSQFLGRAIPIASALGIGFDELVGSVSALTTQGQDTALAVTGIRAALNAVLNPSADATELAQRLGLEFNATGLRARGLAGFMAEVTEKTGGSEVALTTLFGSIEAGTAVLSLAGQGGERLADIMDQMADRTGAADQAFEDINKRISQRFLRVVGFAGEKADELGSTLLNVLVPAAEEVIKVFEGAEDRSIALEVAMKALAVTAGVLLVQSVGSAAVSMVAASAATGVWWTALQLLTVQGGAAIVMTQALGAAVRFALGPFGLMITVVGLLTAAWLNHTDAAERARLENGRLYQIQEQMRTQSVTLTNLTLNQAEARLLDAQATRRQVLEQYRLTQARVVEARAALEAARGRGGPARDRILYIENAREALEAAEVAARDARELLVAASGDITGLERRIIALRASASAPGEPAGGGINLLGDGADEYERVVESLRRTIEELGVARGLEREIVSNLLAAGLSPDDRTSEAARNIIELTEAVAQLEDQQVLAEFNDDMDRQNALLRVNAREREAVEAIMALEEKTLGDLTDQQRASVRASIAMNQALRDQRDILDEIAEPYEDFRNTTAALDALLKQGAISAEQYALRLQEAQSALLQARVDEGTATPYEGILAGLDLLAERGRNVAASLRDSFGSFFQSISTGFADSIGRAIVFADDLGSALHNIAANALAELISALIQLGIQQLVNFAIGESVAKAALASSVVQAKVTAAAWAPAAAAVSLASFGANSASAIAGMTAAYTLSQTLAAVNSLGGFREGGFTGNGGVNDVAGVVHGQEYVFDAGATARIGVENLDALRRGDLMLPVAANDHRMSANDMDRFADRIVEGIRDHGGITVDARTIVHARDKSSFEQSEGQIDAKKERRLRKAMGARP